MTAGSNWRGHSIINRDGCWVYADDGTSVAATTRPCGQCGQNTPLGRVEVDPCLGVLPGVDNACCGHGVRSEAYIQFTNGVRVTGFVVESPLGISALTADNKEQ